MQQQQLESIIKNLENDLSKAKAELENLKNKDALRLYVDEDGRLCIKYKCENIGAISTSGECYILSCKRRVQLYNQWRKDGMPIDESVVIWRGRCYHLKICTNKKIYLLCESVAHGSIYEFTSCVYMENCKDDNIIRFEHNNRPVGFWYGIKARDL